MKTPILPPSDAHSPSTTRRQVLKAATIGAGLSLLPGARAFAAAAMTTTAQKGGITPTLAMGYWKHVNLKTMSKITADDVVADALSVAPSPGTYELRILGVNTKVSLSMEAQYAGGATHRFWQAWTEQGLLQHSPNSAIRWWANNTKPLPLSVSTLGSGTATTQVTAQSGTYVLGIGPNAQALPAWSDLALRPKSAKNSDLVLVSRSTGAVVTFPYAVFSVQQIVA